MVRFISPHGNLKTEEEAMLREGEEAGRDRENAFRV